jgi:hypothetical protein
MAPPLLNLHRRCVEHQLNRRAHRIVIDRIDIGELMRVS